MGPRSPDAPTSSRPGLPPATCLPTRRGARGGGVGGRGGARGAPLALDRLALAPAPWRPVPGTTWQWQLSGRIVTSIDVAMYDGDLVETPGAGIESLHRAGRAVGCYFTARAEGG